MVREDILNGLKLALAKGETLKQAMITFYNSGYKKEEIEEAARALQQQPQQQIQPQMQLQPQMPMQPQQPQQPMQPSQFPQQIQPPQPYQQQYQQVQLAPGTPAQHVSSYGKKKSGTTLIIVLGVVLLILIGALVTIFLFRQEIMGLFS